MSTYKNLITVCCAAALALGLAACGGGGSSTTSSAPQTQPSPVDPAVAQRGAINMAITAARTAVEGLTDDASDAAIGGAETAVAAAKKAVADASAVPAEEKAAFTTAIAAIEGSLGTKRTAIMAKRTADADAMKAAGAKDGKALHKALGATPLSNLHQATLGATGLVVSTDDTDTTEDVTLKAGDSAGTLGTWKGTNYAHMNPNTKVANSAVVYTNQGAPRSRPFGALHSASAATSTSYDATTRILTIAPAVANKFIGGSSKWPTAGGRNYPPDDAQGAGDEVSFSGTYDGVSGTYLCTGAGTGNECSASWGATGITLAGTWTFKHGVGAMVSQADANYLYFGWWLTKDKDGKPTAASAFTGVMGDVDGDVALTNPNTLSGSATYTGAAAGKFALSNPLDGTGSAGHFTADATLTAKFGAIAAPNNGGISGTINNFMANGGAVPWSVSLHRAPWDDTTAGMFATPTTDDTATTTVDETKGTTWSIDGNAAPRSGTWSGQMYDEKPGNPPAGDSSNVPTSVIGTFQSEFGSIGRMVGAFGAEKQ